MPFLWTKNESEEAQEEVDGCWSVGVSFVRYNIHVVMLNGFRFYSMTGAHRIPISHETRTETSTLPEKSG